ncbi:hypothetical protein [Promicromonospora kroppenstedtii]|uniref:hypothetical protein n=1 Tax=Promicromonospora kroppenstedtii TaxID=440482 RepID=UPI0004B289AD|nr:hypothetical protein [Promicromonospora kroppenstedtii]
MSTTVEASAAATATALRNLYFVRFGFAVVWAALLFAVGGSLSPLTIGLLVLYPLFDVAAAVVDFRSSKAARPTVGLYFNMALSLATAIGLGVAVTSGIPAVLRVWGVWAITAGIVQLIVAVSRYRLGGQWPMILSGGISVFAGTGFFMMSGGDVPALTPLAGYATLGGIFFLVSAFRLHRVAKKES